MGPKILIVDDHEIVRDGIRTLISRSRPEWTICGEASNAAEALHAVQDLDPDVVILDLTMPGPSGLEVSLRIKRLGLRSRVLIFTMHETERIAGEARAAGARGYVLKSQASRDLVTAVERLLADGTFFSPF
jgi:DNA-binding NarL/FixJ family response regulator